MSLWKMYVQYPDGREVPTSYPARDFDSASALVYEQSREFNLWYFLKRVKS